MIIDLIVLDNANILVCYDKYHKKEITIKRRVSWILYNKGKN